MPHLWIGKLNGDVPARGRAVTFTCFGDAKPGDLALLYVARTSKAFSLLARVESDAMRASPWWAKNGSVLAKWDPGLTLVDARSDEVLGGWGLIRRNMTPPAGHEPAVNPEHLRRLATKLPGLGAHLTRNNAVKPFCGGLGPLGREDRVGRALIKCLGESIAEAARLRPEAWGLTVLRNGSGSRLNVGRVEVFLLDGTGDHFIICLRKVLPPRAAITRLGGSVSSVGHASLQDPVAVRFPEGTFARGFQLVREAHFAAMSEAARYRHYSWKASHSPVALRRVGDVTGLDLPDPLYAKSARKAFLLTSNPETERDGFNGFEAGDTGTWRCWNKDPVPGDRLFWLRQGRNLSSRGLFASGFVTRERGRDGKVEYRVEKSGGFSPGALLSMAELANAIPAGPWRTQRSGAAIADDDARVLGQMWWDFLEGNTPWGADEEREGLEGRATRAEVRRLSRDPGLRSLKILAVLRKGGRLVCEVPRCGFDFYAAYGELGCGFAIVHHEDPIGDRERASKTSLSRLRVVCANCHEMLHRGGKTRPLSAIRIRPGWGRPDT